MLQQTTAKLWYSTSQECMQQVNPQNSLNTYFINWWLITHSVRQMAESNTVVACWGDVASYSFRTWLFEFVGCMCKSDKDEDHCRNRWRHLPWSRCLAWNGVSLLLQWEPSLSQNGWRSILLVILHPSCSRSPADDSSQWSKHVTEIELY